MDRHRDDAIAMGDATDVSTLDKGTLVVSKRTIKQGRRPLK